MASEVTCISWSMDHGTLTMNQHHGPGQRAKTMDQYHAARPWTMAQVHGAWTKNIDHIPRPFTRTMDQDHGRWSKTMDRGKKIYQVQELRPWTKTLDHGPRSLTRTMHQDHGPRPWKKWKHKNSNRKRTQRKIRMTRQEIWF